MNVRGILLYSALAISLFFLLIALLSLVISIPSSESSDNLNSFKVLKSDIASDTFFYQVDAPSNSKATLVVSKWPLFKKIVIYSPSTAPGYSNSSVSLLFDTLNSLKKYGFSVDSTVSTTIPSNSIFIIPTGAMPSSFLDQLNSTSSIVYYFGSSDLVLDSAGVRRSDFSGLLRRLDRFVWINSTLDEFFENPSRNLSNDILYSLESDTSSANYSFKNSGLKTLFINSNGANFSRLIYFSGDSFGVSDQLQSPSEKLLFLSSNSIYPNQKTTLSFSLNRSIGSAILTYDLNGKIVSNESLGRITSENVFLRRFDFNESGNYVISLSDSSGRISSTILNVKKMEVLPVSQSGLNYRFNVLLDDSPLESSSADVSILNSSQKRKYYISNGSVVVSASLPQGKNTLLFEIDSQSIPVEITNNNEPIFDFYFKYGTPVIIIILIVFIVSKITKKPIYRLRFNSSPSINRSELRIFSSEIIDAFIRFRNELNLGSGALSINEFALAIKKYITFGSDITEGNFELLIKSLENRNLIKGYLNYFILFEDGDPKNQAILRIIRDHLIQNGIDFNQKNGFFETSSFQIGSPSSKFTKNAIAVFSSSNEIRSYLNSLSSEFRSRIELKIQNGVLIFATLDNFEDYL